MKNYELEAAVGRIFKPRSLSKKELDDLISSYKEEIDDTVFEDDDGIFTPQTFDEYIGQEEAKEILQIMANAARIEERSLPNLLIAGSAGLGKTTLAKILLKGEAYTFTDGNSVNVTYPSLSGYNIIDEIHNVKPDVCDTLNVVLDQGKLRIIGATTNPGMLPGPFRSRFRAVNLTPYTRNDLVRIMENVLIRKQTLTMERSFLKQIAAKSRRTPRTALKILSFIMDVMIVSQESNLSKDSYIKAINILGLDDDGLLPIDRRYLEAFPDNGQPVGLQFLAAVTGIDKETIENEVEPWLMTLKKINRTSRGRELVHES
jgi:holliday junction DNA helicase RuvB